MFSVPAIVQFAERFGVDPKVDGRAVVLDDDRKVVVHNDDEATLHSSGEEFELFDFSDLARELM